MADIHKAIDEKRTGDAVHLIDTTDEVWKYINNLYEHETCLFRACYHGDIHVVKRLLEIPEINVNKGQILRKESPLHIATIYGHHDIVNLMLHAGAGCTKDRQGNTPLHISAKNGDVEILEGFLKKYKRFINEKNNEGNNPLHLAADAGKLSSATKLLKSGADSAARNKLYKTASDLAKTNGHNEIVTLLGQGGFHNLANNKTFKNKTNVAANNQERKLNKRISDLEEELSRTAGNILKQIKESKSQYESQYRTINNHAAKQKTLEHKISQIESKVTKVDIRVGKLESDGAQLETRIRKLEQAQWNPKGLKTVASLNNLYVKDNNELEEKICNLEKERRRADERLQILEQELEKSSHSDQQKKTAAGENKLFATVEDDIEVINVKETLRKCYCKAVELMRPKVRRQLYSLSLIDSPDNDQTKRREENNGVEDACEFLLQVLRNTIRSKVDFSTFLYALECSEQLELKDLYELTYREISGEDRI